MVDIDYTPGQNIKKLFSTESANVDAVVGQSGSGLDLSPPEDPGPAVTGRTPVVGELRRQSDRDVPVLRDRIGTLVD